jgi:hypothetical protein
MLLSASGSIDPAGGRPAAAPEANLKSASNCPVHCEPCSYGMEVLEQMLKPAGTVTLPVLHRRGGSKLLDERRGLPGRTRSKKLGRG